MAVVLEINTKKTLYRPVEIKIDGKLFKVRETTLNSLEAIQTLQNDAAAGSAAAIRQMLEAVIEGPIELLGKLTIDQVTDVIEAAVKKSVNPGAAEKNGPGPGRNKSR